MFPHTDLLLFCSYFILFILWSQPLLSPVFALWVCAAVAQVSIPSPARSPHFGRAPGSEIRRPARSHARAHAHALHTRTQRPAPQTAKAAKAGKRGIIHSGSQEAVFSGALEVFPWGKEGRGSFYTLLKADIPPPFFLQGEDVSLRVIAPVQVVSPTEGRLPLSSSKSLKKRTHLRRRAF